MKPLTHLYSNPTTGQHVLRDDTLKFHTLNNTEFSGWQSGHFDPRTGWVVGATIGQYRSYSAQKPDPISWSYGNWNLPPEEPMSGVCFHEWKDYVGFTNRFHYCDKCEEKKPWEAK